MPEGSRRNKPRNRSFGGGSSVRSSGYSTRSPSVGSEYDTESVSSRGSRGYSSTRDGTVITLTSKSGASTRDHTKATRRELDFFESPGGIPNQSLFGTQNPDDISEITLTDAQGTYQYSRTEDGENWCREETTISDWKPRARL